MVLFCKPRVCGEKRLCAPPIASAVGSPPRMRGKVVAHCVRQNAVRITPAYAGKSAQLEGASPLAQDHPRVCGEKRDFSRLPPFLQGSPPRMRGKGERKRRHSNPRGITPAYAGKRRLCVVAAHLGRDHPRVCGEKCAPTAQQNTATGSPPRMRGKAGQIQSQTPELGITPAYAGKS